MNDQRLAFQSLALVVVIGLLALTAWGDAKVMFLASLASLLVLFVWFVTDQKTWLAAVSGLAFAITALSAVKSLF